MKSLIAAAIALFITCICLPARADMIPAAAFAKLPQFKSMALSRDGRYIVGLEAKGETYHAVVIDLEKKSAHLLMAADPGRFMFNWCRFANNQRVICEIYSDSPLYAGDYTVGARWYKEHHYLYAPVGGQCRRIQSDAAGTAGATDAAGPALAVEFAQPEHHR